MVVILFTQQNEGASMVDRSLTGHEIILEPHDTIQSRTDTRGVIDLANHTMVRISQYSREELIGAPHSILRHPHMPRSAFYAMWQIIQGGDEFFGFVNNRAKSGDNYWVFVRVAPRTSASGEITGYSSVRIRPKREAVEEWSKIYADILAVEQKYPREEQVQAGYQAIQKAMRKRGFRHLTDWVMKSV
nr:PAS domain-containing protein [Thioalkalivibrio sp. ALE11]